MGALVEETTFLGQPAVRGANDDLAFVVVPGWGSNLLSLVDQKTGAELLRVPGSAAEFWGSPVLYGTPVLFPPNRIEGGRFTYKGRDYRFDVNEPELGNHIHGLVYHRPWDVLQTDTEGVGRAVVATRFDALQSRDRDDIARQFPHHFVITMRYILDGGTLHKTAEVHNAGSEPFPFGLGFHTTFRFPEEAARFALTVERRWQLDDKLLPTGRLEPLPYEENLRNGMSLRGIALDDAFFVGDAGWSGGTAPGSAATIRYRAGSAELEIRYEADRHFKHWVVYNADGRSGFICPEPYTWITNAPNLDLPASVTGLQELRPGETKVFATSISVRRRLPDDE